MIFEMERERGAVKTHAAPPKKERRSRSRSEFQKRAALPLPLRNFGAPLRSAAPRSAAPPTSERGQLSKFGILANSNPSCYDDMKP